MTEDYPAKKARQGRRGVPILIILAAALILAAIAWWGAEIYGIWIEPSESQQIDSDSPTE